MKLPRYMKIENACDGYTNKEKGHIDKSKVHCIGYKVSVKWWGWPIIFIQMIKSKQVEIECKWYHWPLVIIQLLRTWGRIVKEVQS